MINKFNEEEIKSEFDKEVVDFKTETHNVMINQNLNLRSKIRFKFLDILHGISKIFVVSYNLNIEPYRSYSSPLFISLCGLCKATFSIIKEYVKASDFDKIFGIKKTLFNNSSCNSEENLVKHHLYSNLKNICSIRKSHHNLSDVLLDYTHGV